MKPLWRGAPIDGVQQLPLIPGPVLVFLTLALVALWTVLVLRRKPAPQTTAAAHGTRAKALR